MNNAKHISSFWSTSWSWGEALAALRLNCQALGNPPVQWERDLCYCDQGAISLLRWQLQPKGRSTVCYSFYCDSERRIRARAVNYQADLGCSLNAYFFILSMFWQHIFMCAFCLEIFMSEPRLARSTWAVRLVVNSWHCFSSVRLSVARCTIFVHKCSSLYDVRRSMMPKVPCCRIIWSFCGA